MWRRRGRHCRTFPERGSHDAHNVGFSNGEPPVAIHPVCARGGSRRPGAKESSCAHALLGLVDRIRKVSHSVFFACKRRQSLQLASFVGAASRTLTAFRRDCPGGRALYYKSGGDSRRRKRSCTVGGYRIDAAYPACRDLALWFRVVIPAMGEPMEACTGRASELEHASSGVHH